MGITLPADFMNQGADCMIACRWTLNFRTALVPRSMVGLSQLQKWTTQPMHSGMRYAGRLWKAVNAWEYVWGRAKGTAEDQKGEAGPNPTPMCGGSHSRKGVQLEDGFVGLGANSFDLGLWVPEF